MKQTIKVQEWEKDIAVHIPKAFAEQLDLLPGSRVAPAIEGNKLVVAPVNELVYSLDELLAGITMENRHDEVDTGAAAGGEA